MMTLFKHEQACLIQALNEYVEELEKLVLERPYYKRCETCERIFKSETQTICDHCECAYEHASSGMRGVKKCELL